MEKSAETDDQFQINIFINPPKKYYPLIRWWWPGLAVEPDEIKREIELMDSAGFGGFEIQPFLIGGNDGQPSEKVHRMAPNPYFYDMIRVVLEECRKHNLIADLNLGSSWPPGGTYIDKPHALKTLMMGTSIVKGPKSIEMSVPKIQLNPYYKYRKIISSFAGGIQDDFSKYINEFKLVACVAVKPRKKSAKIHFIFPKATPLNPDSCIDITSKVDSNQILKWDVPEGTWQIFSFYGGPTGMMPMSCANSDQHVTSLVVDILDKVSTIRLLEGFFKFNSQEFEKIKPYLGKEFRALFTDSQEIADEWFWTSHFFEEFKRLRGYDIIPYLPANFIPNRDNQFLEVVFRNRTPAFEFKKDRIGERIRHDWLTTLSDLWSNNYIKQISRWALSNANGIKHRIQTYGMPVDLLKTFGAADIPETETLFSGSLDFFKIAGSAGIAHNKKIVSAETFSWAQRDLMINPIKWKVTCDRLFISGINQIVYHGWTYQNYPEKYPGRYPWRGAGFSEDLNPNSPFWKYYPILNMYVTRAQYLMNLGETQANIGIFYDEWNYTYKTISGEEMEEGTLPGYDSGKAKGFLVGYKRTVFNKNEKYIKLQQIIGHQLMEYGYYYIHVNEEIILNAPIENNKLAVGSARLEALILIDRDSISLKLAEKLEKCAQSGIKIVFNNKIPNRESGFLNYRENDIKINEIMDRCLKGLFKKVQKKTHVGDYLKKSLGTLPFAVFSKPEPDIHYIYKKWDDGALYFFRSASQFDYETDIIIESNQIAVFLLDLWTGTIFTYPSVREEDKTRIHLEFEPYGSKMILLSNKIKTQDHPTYSDQKISQNSKNEILLNKWHLKVNQRTIQGTFESIELDLDTLKDWRKIKVLKYSSGPGIYETEFDMLTPLTSNSSIYLSLGKVHDVASVKVNGHECGERILPPYTFDITPYVQTGTNKLEIMVLGCIQNLFKGYAKNYDKEWSVFRKRVLMPIGILGPVKITFN